MRNVQPNMSATPYQLIVSGSAVANNFGIADDQISWSDATRAANDAARF
jgi:hypothetical protein